LKTKNYEKYSIDIKIFFKIYEKHRYLTPPYPKRSTPLTTRLVTAQCKGEIVISEWVDIDINNGWWSIPAQKAKNKLSHRVPLSPLAFQLLERVKALSGSSKWLFLSLAKLKMPC
jgi:integrase